jgi:predicted metal-dependent enzyme (double-stranded beta helix superfamily)
MAHALRDRLLASPAAARPLGAEEILAFGRSIDLACLDLGAYRQFTATRYARNTIHCSEHFELVAICWLPKQASSIHDHGRSHCLYVIVEGEMQEEMFVLDADGRPRRTQARNFGRGQITIAAPTDVHRIVNATSENLVTLHVYSPPLDDRVTNFTPIPTYKALPA